MTLEPSLQDLSKKMSDAVAFYWRTRARQREEQAARGARDQGSRAAVTGGAQTDMFLQVIAEYLERVGITANHIYFRQHLELPGFFRPTKEWDLLVVKDGQLVAALETKSQVGSFGNNFNNRTEEAMGSALDLWTAFREGALNATVTPWLGYLFLLQDCDVSRRPVRTREPHFAVFPEFKNASYATRYELFCRKLVRERHYSASAFLMSNESQGINGVFHEPAKDLTTSQFMRSLLAHASFHV